MSYKTVQNAERLDTDLLRRYVENEVNVSEREHVERLVASSSLWATELDRMRSYLATLNRLPVFDPPSRVWEHIEGHIKELQSTPHTFTWRVREVWTSWMEPVRYSLTPRVVAWSTVALCLFVYLLMSSSIMEPTYEIVDVEEVNGMGLEAEMYIANHDLNSNQPVTQENLLAFYSNQ